jgi:acetyltransferase-like isoleucine patch superfamily enzyme
MSKLDLFPLLPDALCRATGRYAFKGTRAGTDLTQARCGAGSPKPRIHNKDGRMTLGRVFLAAGVQLSVEKGGALTIGDDTVLDAGVEVIAWSSVTIGRACYLGWQVLVMDTDLHRIGDRPLLNKPVFIGNGVRIGVRAMILKGVTIGDGATIHPGSIVTHDIPAGAEVRPPAGSVKALLPAVRPPAPPLAATP